MTERTWVIYVLVDPRSPQNIRYVGITHGDPAKRLARHMSNARKLALYHSGKWIASLLRVDINPTLTVIEQGAGPTWEDRERHWISWYREQGAKLTNHADGGRGPVGCVRSPETREKLRRANLGKKQSPQLIEKRIAPIRGMKHTAQSRANMSAGRKGHSWTDAERITHEKVRDDQWRTKISVSNKKTYARRKDLGLIKTNAGCKASEETREKLRQAHLGKTQSEETRAKRSASMKAFWARKKAETF